MKKAVYIINLIVAFVNCLLNLYLHNTQAAIGWACCVCWLYILLSIENKKVL